MSHHQIEGILSESDSTGQRRLRLILGGRDVDRVVTNHEPSGPETVVGSAACTIAPDAERAIPYLVLVAGVDGQRNVRVEVRTLSGPWDRVGEPLRELVEQILVRLLATAPRPASATPQVTLELEQHAVRWHD